MAASQKSLHLKTEWPKPPAWPTCLERQTPRGSDSSDPEGLLRRTVQRPFTWVPGRTRLSYSLPGYLLQLGRGNLDHRRGYLRLLRSCILILPSKTELPELSFDQLL